MSEVRDSVAKLVALGRLPDEAAAEQADLDARVALLDQIGLEAPSRDEVVALLPLFPADDNSSFGLAWTLLHIIESSPDWPIWEALDAISGEWAAVLALRLKNGGYRRPEASEVDSG